VQPSGGCLRRCLHRFSFSASLLHALARDEAAGRRRPRLTEPKLDSWTRFRGRLGSVDLVTLLFEDAAVLHRIPFDPEALGGSLRPSRLPEWVTDGWLQSIGSLRLTEAAADYTPGQARLLGLPTGMARTDLHAVKAHQKVLELPGTGGQLAQRSLHGPAAIDQLTQQLLVVAPRRASGSQQPLYQRVPVPAWGRRLFLERISNGCEFPAIANPSVQTDFDG
jgi:hypothetical protein